jgi:hypothetical protein
MENDATTCGGCGNLCDAFQACVARVCTCSGGLEDCGGVCVDTERTAAHCGACFNDCGAGWGCVDGGCVNSIEITPGEGYGHHGACDGWNGCGDAETCATWACEYRGYAALSSYGTEAACNSGTFSTCHLFSGRDFLDEDWGVGCAVMGVGDVRCVP